MARVCPNRIAQHNSPVSREDGTQISGCVLDLPLHHIRLLLNQVSNRSIEDMLMFKKPHKYRKRINNTMSLKKIKHLTC